MDEATQAVTEPEMKWEGAEKLRPYLIPIGDATPFPGNPSKKQSHVDWLIESLQRFGQVRAIVIRDDNTIVAGHHVTKAAKALGWTHIAAISNEFASTDEARDYLLADNFLGRAGVDPEFNADQMSMARDVKNWAGMGITRDQYEDEMAVAALKTEQVKIADLKAHENNYKKHTAEQVAHIAASLKQHGIYRNVVVANDGTILAGHGIVQAATEIGLKNIPVQRLRCGPNDPEALKVLTGDNELGRFAELDDRQLTMALKKVVDDGDMGALLGTGYDAQALANLVMITRPADEIQDHDHALEWLGLPEFVPGDKRHQLILNFDSEEERETWTKLMPGSLAALVAASNVIPVAERGINIMQKRPGAEGDTEGTRTWSASVPDRPRQDLSSLKFITQVRGDDVVIELEQLAEEIKSPYVKKLAEEWHAQHGEEVSVDDAADPA